MPRSPRRECSAPRPRTPQGGTLRRETKLERLSCDLRIRRRGVGGRRRVRSAPDAHLLPQGANAARSGIAHAGIATDRTERRRVASLAARHADRPRRLPILPACSLPSEFHRVAPTMGFGEPDGRHRRTPADVVSGRLRPGQRRPDCLPRPSEKDARHRDSQRKALASRFCLIVLAATPKRARNTWEKWERLEKPTP